MESKHSGNPSDPRPTYYLGVDDHDSPSAPDGGGGSSPAPWPSYKPGLFYDEMVTASGEPRPEAVTISS